MSERGAWGKERKHSCRSRRPRLPARALYVNGKTLLLSHRPENILSLNFESKEAWLLVPIRINTHRDSYINLKFYPIISMCYSFLESISFFAITKCIWKYKITVRISKHQFLKIVVRLPFCFGSFWQDFHWRYMETLPVWRYLMLKGVT